MRTIQGCMLDLLREPSQRSPPMVTITSGQTQISEEIERLLEKQAIRRVRNQNGQFVSRIFTVPKKDGSHRPVVNLRPLNQFIRKVRFKMEGMMMVKSILQMEDWMVSIDLKDAYLSVPMMEEHRKYLRFQWKGQLYEFPIWDRAVPLGYSQRF